MFDVRTILLPFDFSPASRAAASHGFELAHQFGAAVELLHVVPHGFVEYSAFDTGKYRAEHIPPDEDLYRWLDEAGATLLPADWQGPWRRMLLTGDPAACIAERAAEVPGPLVVMPTHGFGKVRRLILGSVAAKVLHDLETPVLTGAHTEEGAVFESARYQKIACALDLREDSRETLEWAWGLAQACSAELEVIHIVNWLERAPAESERLTAKLREALLSATALEVRELMAAVGCEAKVRTKVGSPLELLPQAVDEAQADVLVIGRGRDRSRVGQIWANAYGLIRRSPVPVASV